MNTILYKDLGLIEYGKAWDLQEEMMKAGLAIKSKRYNAATAGNSDGVKEDSIANYLLLCEHPHVYTLGKSGKQENLLINEEQLGEKKATFYKTNRGGDITYHGPGQIVGYPILDLEQYETDLGKYMRNLEEVIIRTLSEFGIEAGRLDGATGVWLDPDNSLKARKICAMGVKSSRWITMHGFALNVNADLTYFGNIIPCGITDKAVTSMNKELEKDVNMSDVKEIVLAKFGEVFDSKIIPATSDEYI